MTTGEPTTGPVGSGPSAAESSLAGSLQYYDTQAKRSRLWYQSLKLMVIGCGASIPVLTTVDAPTAITAVVGAMVVVIEGIQQVFGFHERYLGYRAAWNQLDREARLFHSGAGAYAGAADPQRTLAERIDGILAAETARWEKDAGNSSGGSD